jgi:hypothetical protein
MPPLIKPEDARLARFRDSFRMSRRAFFGGGSAIIAGAIASRSARARLFGGAGAAATSGDFAVLRSWGIFNVKDPTYGAVGNTTQISDAAISSGSNTLTSAGSSFTSAYIGRTAAVAGAGASGKFYTRTITAVPSGTTLTLNSTAAGTTVSAALAYIGTDDTTAIQAAVDAAMTFGGGEVDIPGGIYMIAGALGGVGNSQLLISVVDQSTTPPAKLKAISINGLMYGPTSYNIFGSDQLPSTSGTILFSPVDNSGTAPAMISCGPSSGAFSTFSGINVAINELSFRTAYSPQNAIDNINMNNAYAFVGRGIVCDVAATTNQMVATAPAGTLAGSGIRTPRVDNGAKTTLIDCTIAGKPIGFDWCEHANLIDCETYFCKVGYLVNSANHALYGERIAYYHTSQGFVMNGASEVRLTVGQVAVEHAASGWPATTADVNDPSNLIHGTCSAAVVLAGVGPDSTFSKTGGTNFTCTVMS